MKFSEWIALSQNTYKSIRLVYVDDNGKEVKRILRRETSIALIYQR